MKAIKNGTDERLLIEAAQKDPSRFAELYELNLNRVYAYVATRVRNRDLAQDLTSEVFHQALANLGRFEWRGIPFAAWLYRIAANAISDLSQQSAREHGNPIQQNTGEVDMEDIETKAALFQLVETLPTDQRRVIIQRFVEQRSIREIARNLKRTEGAVKQLQFRALQNLRSRMEEANG